MSQAYTPGLKVTPRIRHQVRRILPLSGDVMVKKGDKVQARDVAAQTDMPGDIFPVNLANVLAISPGDVPKSLLVKEGDSVEVGQTIARSEGIFGFFKSEYQAKTAGVVESISGVTGQVILRGQPRPIQVLAYLTGEVVEVLPNEGCVIEADICYVQGIFGIGGEAYGVLESVCETPHDELTADRVTDNLKDKIIIGGARMTGDAVRKAIEIGAAAIISGGMDDSDLKDILGYDLGVAVTGSEHVGTTVIITEGFGDIAMAERTFDLLRTHVGQSAAVNGATQIRAGVMRPEILIPLAAGELSQVQEPRHFGGQLEVGRPVRIIRDPYFGRLGEVADLPAEPAILGSGSKARVLDVKLNDGEQVRVPRANVELIEL
ncbi:hypothetical protein [Thalassoroseus pseudoceratinae]|uniref:hypothetical protein n=1 Tax=Thalassoroseus pseudoceratinae TaxID=2713176 RepID=UPI00141F5A5D|nr:hypothetical protein [Thalassoroseus pseudoceratinae]